MSLLTKKRHRNNITPIRNHKIKSMECIPITINLFQMALSIIYTIYTKSDLARVTSF